MAKISKSAEAPGDLRAFTFANTVVEVDNLPLETDDPVVIAAADQHPFLDVEREPVDANVAPEGYDVNDPHDNPRADHLSASGSDEARSAADANERAILEAVGNTGLVPNSDNPTVSESVNHTFDVVGVEDAPQLPDSPEPAPADPVVEEPAAAPAFSGFTSDKDEDGV